MGTTLIFVAYLELIAQAVDMSLMELLYELYDLPYHNENIYRYSFNLITLEEANKLISFITEYMKSNNIHSNLDIKKMSDFKLLVLANKIIQYILDIEKSL